MKKIVVCFDGRWNKTEDPTKVTNVVRLYRSVLGADTAGIGDGSPSAAPSVQTVKWYDPGVGTKWYDRVQGGTFGYGLSRNIREGYKFLVDHYEQADEIYLFGFSRGAYSARSLAGLIRKIGLVKKEHAVHDEVDRNEAIVRGYEIYRERDETPDTTVAEQFKTAHSWGNVGIKLLGVWDTVGALGVPFGALRRLSEPYAFHDTGLSRIIENAYHAVAVDEHRADYKTPLWDSPTRPGQTMEQVWFVGAHSNVGGGSKKSQYSRITLRWMQERAQLNGSGLEIDPTQIPDPDDEYLRTSVSDSFLKAFWGFYARISRLFGQGRYLRPVKQLESSNESVDETVRKKMREDSRYRPRNAGL